MSGFVPTNPEQIFTYGAPQLKFGAGARRELAHDLTQFDARRVLLVADPNVDHDDVLDSLKASYEVEVFTGVRVEPTDESFIEAIDFARDRGPFDVIVALGGGSTIDTAKAVNLLVTNPGDLMDYVNVPVGAGRAPVKPLLPLVALPTTTGTGSESTTICVLDVVSQRVKTGISHPRLRPTLAIVDPELTMSQPAAVTAASGLDILCHALESYTARPYTSYEHKDAAERVPYCGSNPISDLWAEKAMALMADSFETAVRDGSNVEARSQMAQAATFAGLGFGNAGVHIPHANAYPIAGQARHGLVPHGMAVSMTAPEAFRFTFDAAPERHVRAARLLAPAAQQPDDARDFLPDVLRSIMRGVGMPAGLGELGFVGADVDDLVEGALKQQRLLATAPREVTEADLASIISRSVELW